MSRRKSIVEKRGYTDTEFSCGDSNRSNPKQLSKEENNNEVDELSKELSMGCIVDTVKRPPNICVETYVEKDDEIEGDDNHLNEEDAYSDDFEELNVVEEEKSDEIKQEESETRTGDNESKCSSLSSEKTRSLKARSEMRSAKPKIQLPRKDTLSSISIPPNMRKNMSFTNERLREIERQNHILLKKILSARNKKPSSIPKPKDGKCCNKLQPPAAVSRRQQQSRIDRENMILLKKIQRAKSSVSSLRR